MKLGWRVYGFGVMALGIACLAFGDFDPSQQVPAGFPARGVLWHLADWFMVVAGAAIQFRRTVKWAAGALTAYYTLIVVVLMNGAVVVGNYRVYGAYSDTAEELAIAAAGWIIYAECARRSAGVIRAGQVVFGVCAVLFGGAHFFYLNLTVPLVPKWLPPSALFWAYATGIAHIAAGLAIISGIRARVAAELLTLMYASFTPLVHLPMLIANHTSFFEWTENTLNVALTGCAWVVAESIGRRRVLTGRERSR